MSKEKPPEIIGNSFESVLRNQRRGHLLSELSEKLQAAVLAVKEHTKEATVTLTFKIAPANGDASAISVTDEIKVKLPEARKANTLFYSTDDGRLVRDDPNQTEMELKTLAKPAAPVPATESNPDRSAVA